MQPGGRGGNFCSETELQRGRYINSYFTLFQNLHFCGLWWISFFFVLLLVSWQEIPSAFSAPDISSHLKEVCVLCGNGSRVLALDILVLCLLCCFTAHYKAKMT